MFQVIYEMLVIIHKYLSYYAIFLQVKGLGGRGLSWSVDSIDINDTSIQDVGSSLPYVESNHS